MNPTHLSLRGEALAVAILPFGMAYQHKISQSLRSIGMTRVLGNLSSGSLAGSFSDRGNLKRGV
jgi:hypothetical protein